MEDWGAVKARLRQFESDRSSSAGGLVADIRVALERDKQQQLEIKHLKDKLVAVEVEKGLREDALRQQVEELERQEGHPIYCPECGQPRECACLGNWRERAEAAEKQVEELEREIGRLKALGLERQEWRSRMGLSTQDVIVLRAEAAEAELAAFQRSYAAEKEARYRAEAKLARCVEALEALMEREELDLKHTYTTCDFGDSTNADRGCIWCVARAALAAAKGGGLDAHHRKACLADRKDPLRVLGVAWRK